MQGLLAAENTLFAVALLLLALLALIQLVGISHIFPDPDFDADLDADIDGADGAHIDMGGSMVSLLGLGHVPLIVWLSFFLASFGVIGLGIQALAVDYLGRPLSGWVASTLAFVATLPINGLITNGLGNIWPRDETTAITLGALLGRRAKIVVGQAGRGNPARAIAYDRHGQMHNIMVEPHEDHVVFFEGQDVLLIRKDGDTFYATDDQGTFWLQDTTGRIP